MSLFHSSGETWTLTLWYPRWCWRNGEMQSCSEPWQSLASHPGLFAQLEVGTMIAITGRLSTKQTRAFKWLRHSTRMTCIVRHGKLMGMERDSVYVLWFGPELVLWRLELDPLCFQRKMSSNLKHHAGDYWRLRHCFIQRKEDLGGTGELFKCLQSWHGKEN